MDNQTHPFTSAEEAWLWTMGRLIARRAGEHVPRSEAVARPCGPDDVVACLDRLYQERRLDMTHARILRVWGEMQTPPNPHERDEQADYAIWAKAMQHLEGPLRAKGIVA